MKLHRILFLLFVLSAVLIASCKKDETTGNDDTGGGTGTQIQAIIAGMVTDENDNPVSGASVSVNGLSASTDYNGLFVLQGSVDQNRCILRFTKPGYLDRLHAFAPRGGTVNYVRIGMSPMPASQYISSGTGGNVVFASGGSVAFQSNSFVINGTATPYSGQVEVIARHYSPSNPDFGRFIPGGDLAGVSSGGEDVSLYSYGMATVILKGSNDEELQLAAGSTATMTFPIASFQVSSAPATIPLWYLDETDGLWKEEGSATKVGNNYVGTVTHFSTWNCDYSGPRAAVNGYVKDCEGTPLANVVVTINGGVTVTTDANGYYSTWVPSGWPLDFQVLPQGVIVLPSQLEMVAPLSQGQTFTVPDLIVPCGSRINGHITNCNNEIVSGTAALKLNNQIVNYVITTDGYFSIMGAELTTYDLLVTDNSGIAIVEVTTPAATQVNAIGAVQACNQFTSNLNFIIDGDGFNQTAVSMVDEGTNSGVYYTLGDYTSCSISGLSSSGPCSVWLQFDGNIPLNIILPTGIDSSGFYLSLGGSSYYAVQGSPNPFNLSVAEYGAVGDSITGTFSGDLYSFSLQEYVTLTNGTFAFKRDPDQ